MKKLTDTQKKWALTATMIAALGCSFSFNSQHAGYSKIDFASEKPQMQLPTSKGMLDVKLTEDGSRLKAVLSPMKDSEGKASFECADCTTTLFVDKKITDTASDIQVALMAELVKPKKVEKQDVSSVVDDRDDRDDDRKTSQRSEREEKREEERKEKISSREQRKRDYAAIEDAAYDAGCDDEETKAEKSKCLVESFADILSEEITYKVKDSRGKTREKTRHLNSDAAQEYFEKELKGDLRNQLRSVSYNPYSNTPSPASIASESIGELLASLPSEFERTRKSALDLTTEAVYDSAVRFRSSAIQASQSRRIEDQNAAFARKTAMLTLFDNLKLNNKVSLDEAASRGNIDAYEATSDFESFVQTANSIASGARRWMGVDNQGRAIYNLNEYQISSTFNGLVDSSLASRSRSEASRYGAVPAPGQSGQSIQNNQGNNVVIPPEMIRGKSFDGMEFGQPRSITDAARTEADRRDMLEGRRY